MPFIVLFVVIPLVEIYMFLAVGEEIGIFKTLLLCVLTAIIGGFLVKQQGLQALFNAQKNLRAGTLPMKELFDGFCLIVAGALLMTPGFVTDFAGFSLLIPLFREFLQKTLVNSGKFKVYSSNNAQNSQNDDVIDGEYEHIQPKTDKIEGK